jgi:methionyl-tRNA formyltransferase
MELKIIYSDWLRRKVDPVTVFDAALKKEADQMFRIMKKYNGLGLSGNQVGLNKRLFVFGYEPTSREDEVPQIPMTALCNPKIVKESKEKDVMAEGCLSLPGLELDIVRSAGITVEAQDLDGNPLHIKAKGLIARIIQHEIDHLNGILFTDRTDNYKRINDYGFARIVFLGSDDFSAPVLQSLIDANLYVIAAITETAKPAGRGRQLVEPIIKELAEKSGVAVFQPADKEDLVSIVRQLQPDLLVLASYGKILPKEALEVPTFGSLNVHPSLLPKYRGATPIQTAILNGDAETGVTIMCMQPEIDAGGIVSQEKILINETDSAGVLKEKLAKKGAEQLIKIIPTYLAGQAEIEDQDESKTTKTKKLTKEMGEINWEKSAEDIDRQIRALQGWPGTYTFLGEKRLKIISAKIVDGRLLPIDVQIEGKSVSSWSDFVRGYTKQLTDASWYGKIYK